MKCDFATRHQSTSGTSGNWLGSLPRSHTCVRDIDKHILAFLTLNLNGYLMQDRMLKVLWRRSLVL